MLRSRKRDSQSSMETVSLSQEISALESGKLFDKPFTLISFQYAVAVRGRYYPCEVGALQFSMKTGIQKAYHSFVSPKPLPTGTFAEAKSHAEETHQLPFLTEFPHWNSDWSVVTNTLWSMIGDSGRVFSKGTDDELKTVLGSFKYLDEKNHSDLSTVIVSPIERLAECIVRRFEAPLGSVDEIDKYLSRPAHDFDPNIRCFYHEGQDSHHCAYATVFRLFFNLMDYFIEKHIIRPDLAIFKVPESFVSRSPSKGPTSRPVAAQQTTAGPSEDNWYCGNWNAISDWCSSRKPLPAVEDYEGSDTSTVVDVSFTQALSDAPHSVVTEISQGESSNAQSVRNAGDIDHMSHQTEQLNTAAIGGIQTAQTRTPTIQVIQVGPPPFRYLPKKICGITVEPMGDTRLVFRSEDE